MCDSEDDDFLWDSDEGPANGDRFPLAATVPGCPCPSANTDCSLISKDVQGSHHLFISAAVHPHLLDALPHQSLDVFSLPIMGRGELLDNILDSGQLALFRAMRHCFLWGKKGK